MREREIARLNHRLGGLKEMRRLPNLLFIVDVRRDAIAVKEANILGIPIIAMVDTNCDPDPIDHVIPSNDDAIRALKLINSVMATAVLEGQAILSSIRAEEEEVATMEDEVAMERYLGPSTLAKIQAEAAGKSKWEDEYEEEYDEYEDEEDEAVYSARRYGDLDDEEFEDDEKEDSDNKRNNRRRGPAKAAEESTEEAVAETPVEETTEEG
jgi:small subunit ribosomal protein S2